MSYRDWDADSWSDETRQVDSRSASARHSESDDAATWYGRSDDAHYPESDEQEALRTGYSDYGYRQAERGYRDTGYATGEWRQPAIPAQREGGEESTEAWVAELRSEGYAAETHRQRGEDRGMPLWAYPDGPPNARPGGARHREDDDESDGGGFTASLLWTSGWFGVPLVLYTLWTLTLDAGANPSCVDGAGEVCASDRTRALTELAGSMPRVGTALLLSLLVSLGLRWASASWRAVTIGFAAAVVGSGLATVLFSVLSGEQIG